LDFFNLKGDPGHLALDRSCRDAGQQDVNPGNPGTTQDIRNWWQP